MDRPKKKIQEKIEKLSSQRRLSFSVQFKKPFKFVSKYWNTLGPGLTTGAADDDPSSIATYSQAGAKYGFQALWFAFVSFPLMAIIQEMCARIGLVTGQGLAANIRKHYTRPVITILTLFLLLTNIFNIGADLGAMAAAVQLLVPQIPILASVVAFGLISTLLPIFVSYTKYARFLKYLSLILFSYIIALFFVKINARELFLNTIIPHITFSKDTIILICAILGATISPCLFFWQTSQEVEESEQRDKNKFSNVSNANVIPKHTISWSLIRNMRIDVWSGMFLSNIVMFAIIAVSGAVLFQNGITSISTAADAAEALRPFAGDFTYILFALGIIGTGLLAVPILAGSASYAVSESLGWKFGLSHKWKEATAFYSVIVISIVIGVLMNIFNINIISILITASVISGIVAPFFILYIVRLSSDGNIMGRYKNSAIVQFIGWCILFIMGGVGLTTLIALIM